MSIILSYTVRIILMYFFTYMSTRILTKKAIAEMTAYEMAGIMILANVAAEPLVDKVVIKSIYGVGVLVLLMIIASRLAIINKFTAFLEHTATFVIENGQLDMKALKRLSLSLNQFEGLLRERGYDKISDIQTAVFEPQGNLSIFPKAENKPITLKDLKIKTKNERITIPLILDGSIEYQNLKHIGKSEEWLLNELKKQGFRNINSEIALAELDPSWNLIVLRK